MDVSQLTDEQRAQLEEKLKNMSPEEIAAMQKQQCIFCKLVTGEIPSKKVYEDEKTIVILDINPAAKGHLLIIPKEHYAIMPQIPDSELGGLFGVAKRLSQLLLSTMKVEGTSVFIANGTIAGQRAQHFIMHLIPRKDGDGLHSYEDKLIDKEMQGKVKTAIADRLGELLGVSGGASGGVVQGKEGQGEPVNVKKTEPQPEKPTESEDVDLEAMFGKAKKREEPEQSDSQEDGDGESEDDVPEEQHEDEGSKEDDTEKGGDVSLDEIANLFK